MVEYYSTSAKALSYLDRMTTKVVVYEHNTHLLIRAYDEPESFLLFRLGVPLVFRGIDSSDKA